ncbi:thioredoxin family protein [Luteimonas sp. BDR2-5]|uniref:thioredoxin family protein n=1 Tax=Proluteimonas luteida TaxID=2878685 RepID=UPI001E51BE83|nr:thioredoxin family protein [Luteimonas sp. BDR2-5]MCD9027146.1 thioredoxin family protein [Luteimonas sp. BDR2-5]
MTFVRDYPADAPDLPAVEATRGLLLLEFGTGWCGHCQAAQPAIGAALASRGDVAHLKVEDGKGRPLGRAFRVKLWPTLVLLRDGREIARVVRPRSANEVERVLDAGIGAAPG